MVIRQTHIFTRDDNQPSRNVQWILAPSYHPDSKPAVNPTPSHLASQYMAAEPSDPLRHLCRAEIMSYRSSPVLS